MVRMVLWCAIRMETPYPAYIQFIPEAITYLAETEVAYPRSGGTGEANILLSRCVIRLLWI